MERATNWLTQLTFNSLRVRLALWALVLLGITQIIVGAVVYFSISAWLIDQVDTNLQVTASQIASVLSDGDSDDAEHYFDSSDESIFQNGDDNLITQALHHEEVFFVRLVDLQAGRVVESSVNLPIDLPPQSLTGETRFDTIEIAEFEEDGEEDDDEDETNDLRLYTLPLSYAPDYALQVGLSLEETHEIIDFVFNLLVGLLAVTVILALISGWFLANRALIPIQGVGKVASEINAQDLTQRLDLSASEVELAQLVQTFNAMLDRLEGAFQRQRQFTADAAHELRTPLSIMQTGLDVTLSKDRDAEQYREALVSVREEVQRLSQLANTLLHLARADTSTVNFTRQSVNLTVLLEAVTAQFETIAHDKNITITQNIAPNLHLHGDEDRLIQMMFNLIDNAVKYTSDGGQVTVTAHNSDQQVEITIADTGHGIPDDERAQIFNRFYRVDHARNRQQGGFGLGLAIVKKTLELHNGTVQVQSALGQGTTFTIVLSI